MPNSRVNAGGDELAGVLRLHKRRALRAQGAVATQSGPRADRQQRTAQRPRPPTRPLRTPNRPRREDGEHQRELDDHPAGAALCVD